MLWLLTVPVAAVLSAALATWVRRSMVEAALTVRLPATSRVALLKMAPPVPGATTSLVASAASTSGVPGGLSGATRRSTERLALVVWPFAPVATTVMLLPAPMPSAR